MDSLLLPVALVVIASIFQGSFGLGMKYMAPLEWEAWWLVHSTTAMLLFPFAWAFLVIPDLLNVILSVPWNILLWSAFFGFLWGIGGILFGKSIPLIGISLTYGIVMGLASSAGSLVPLFQIEGAFSLPEFPYILGGVVLMLVGVVITAYAGIQRDNQITDNRINNLKLGLIIAVTSGLLSALLNIGFAHAEPVAAQAVSNDVAIRNSSLAAWVVVLFGAYIMNAGYSIILLTRNKSWKSFTVAKSGKAYLWSIVAGLCWFAALGVYGQGAALMGELGPVIGWPILLGLSLIISNIWAYLNKEWEGAKSAFYWLLIGLFILIAASGILGFANSL